jgi:predicted RecA/RadA family phage recombinase
MAQHDYVINNQSFPATRTDINNVLLAISSTNSGTSAPSTTYASQLWYDTTNNKLYIRNEDNDAWIPLFLLDQSNDKAGTLATEIDIEDASGTNTAGTALTIKGGAGTGTGAGGSIVFQTADGGSSGSSVNSHATRVTITDDGKVGIGTASPNRLTTLSANSGNAILELQRANANTTGATGAISFIASDTHSVAAIDVIGDGDDEGGILRFLTTSAASDNYYISSTTERLRIQSGGGISFNGDTAAANALDDYEEGTFTPIFVQAGSAISGCTTSINSGKYTKVGNVCTVEIYLKSTAAGSTSASSHLGVGGLPFTAANVGNVLPSVSVGYRANFNTANPTHGIVQTNQDYINLYTLASADARTNSASMIGTYLGSDTYLILNATYLTN